MELLILLLLLIILFKRMSPSDGNMIDISYELYRIANALEKLVEKDKNGQ